MTELENSLNENYGAKDILNIFKVRLKNKTLLNFFKNSNGNEQNRFLKEGPYKESFKIVHDHVSTIERLYIDELSKKVYDGIEKMKESGLWTNLNQVLDHVLETSVEAANSENNGSIRELAKKRPQYLNELNKFSNDELKEAIEYIKSNRE